MKKLIFIDNELLARATEESSYPKNFLKLIGKLPEDYVDTMEVISEFYKLDKQKIYDIIFDTNNIISTFSMYTPNHYGSLQMVLNLLVSAGRNYVKGITYFDSSKKLLRALKNNIYEDKYAINILQAIETNNILTVTEDYDKIVRLRVKLQGCDEDMFYFEDANILKLCSE